MGVQPRASGRRKSRNAPLRVPRTGLLELLLLLLLLLLLGPSFEEPPSRLAVAAAAASAPAAAAANGSKHPSSAHVASGQCARSHLHAATYTPYNETDYQWPFV
jgi:hypothetical protein